jgi:hypothetical protein
MKKILIAILIIVTVGGAFYLKNRKVVKTDSPEEILPKFENFTATFEIYTNGTKRIFTDPKYHNKSLDVYIESKNPSLINVQKPDITWSDFFATLPMKLDKECLTTGTGQVFCSNKDKKLRFYINEIEKQDALTSKISPGDFLKVEYK